MLVIVDNTVHHSALCNEPDKLISAVLFQAATVCYIVLFCTMNLSSPHLPAVPLSFIRSSRQRDNSIGFPTNSVPCVSLRTNVMSVLC